MPRDHDLTSPRTRQTVHANWGLLAAAFSDDTPGVRWYLHPGTGEIVRAVGDERALSSFVDEGFIAIERARSKEQYRWMERYIAGLADRDLAAELSHAVAGKQAFQRFKAALARHPGRTDEWYTFRGKQLARYMRAWLSAHGLEVPRSPPGQPVLLDVEEPGEPVPSRRAQLETLVEELSREELDSLLALAEMLEANAHARRELG